MAMRVPVALDLHGDAGPEPAGERLGHAEPELVEAEVEAARLRQSLRSSRELGNDLDVRVEVGGAHEEAREPGPAQFGLRQPDDLQDVLAEIGLLLP